VRKLNFQNMGSSTTLAKRSITQALFDVQNSNGVINFLTKFKRLFAKLTYMNKVLMDMQNHEFKRLKHLKALDRCQRVKTNIC